MVLKRKFSILITMLVCLFALVGLTSCGGNNTDSSKYTETERNFVDSLDILFIDSLKDPSSLKITKILGSWCDGKLIAFTCTSNNSLGGAVSSNYIIATKGFTFEKSMLPDWKSDDDHIGTTISKGYCVEYALVTDGTYIPNGDVQFAIKIIADFGDEKNRDDVMNITVANANELLTEYKKSQGWA